MRLVQIPSPTHLSTLGNLITLQAQAFPLVMDSSVKSTLPMDNSFMGTVVEF